MCCDDQLRSQPDFCQFLISSIYLTLEYMSVDWNKTATRRLKKFLLGIALLPIAYPLIGGNLLDAFILFIIAAFSYAVARMLQKSRLPI